MINNKKGFTLIELLVVIAIIGLLSTMAVVSLNSARQKARDAKRVSDIKQIQTALELFFNDSASGKYPIVTTALVLGAGEGNTLSSDAEWDDVAVGTIYMSKVPANPKPNGSDYTYAISTGTTYSISFTLEADMPSLGGKTCTATPGGVACT